jgi:small subunit ribosomal protein S27Ae
MAATILGRGLASAEIVNMQIFVKTGQTHLFEVGPNATVADVKDLVQAREGVAAEDLYAVFNGKPLADAELLSLAGVEEEQTLYILGRLLGGGKKRKKKTYTKPKKQKHKHKKIKLRVLKFYKVDDSGKVSRLRKQCPQCGPGIFMATHFDRVYCGKCATTYLVEQEAKGKGKGKK